MSDFPLQFRYLLLPATEAGFVPPPALVVAMRNQKQKLRSTLPHDFDESFNNFQHFSLGFHAAVGTVF